MVNKTVFKLTKQQAEKSIELCLESARSFLQDAEISIENNKKDHLAIPIELALEEIGKAKIIYDKISSEDSKIDLSYKDGIYDHTTKLKLAIPLLDLPDDDDEIIESIMFGDDLSYHLLDPSVHIANKKKADELKNSATEGHVLRLASSFVDFDSKTNEPKIEKSSKNLTKLIPSLEMIINEYPSSFLTY